MVDSHIVMTTWTTAEYDAKAADELATALNLHPAAARVLAARGYTDPEAADRFLKPRLSDLGDPFDLPDMETAAAAVWNAIDDGLRIVIHGDYDVDGISSTALLTRVLRALGADVATFIPDRMDDGYGLNVDTLKKCVHDLKARFIITVDCGTCSTEAVQWAAENGVDVVITDHHELSGPPAPAAAVVNPKLGNDPLAAFLAGVGVTFKLCHALVKIGRMEERPETAEGRLDLRAWLDLVALGTVADIVPLAGENRTFVRHGLKTMEQSRWAGIEALKKVAGINAPLRAYHVGYLLGPRLNAAGRIESAESALALLLTNNPAEADEIAQQLDDANRTRRQWELQVLAEAEQQLIHFFDPARDRAIVVSDAGWHPGVIGIVASRLSRKYCRPAVVIGENGRGSCRSIPAFDLISGLDACAPLLLKHGGHKMAAGLEIEAERIGAFRDQLNSIARDILSEKDLAPEIHIDAWIDPADADEALYESVGMLGPFGECNPEPVWGIRHAVLFGQPKEVGNGKHLQMLVSKGNTQRKAIGFNMGGMEVPDGPLDIAFRLLKSEYNGRVSYDLNLSGLRPAEN